MNKPIVWTIAGSDSGGGAGIQADLHAFHALDTHGCSIITATTAQNSVVVKELFPIPTPHVTEQINALSEDLPAQAIKLGMLGNADTMSAVLDFLRSYQGKVVLDPVMVATSGAGLIALEEDTYREKLKQFYPLVDVITPNIPEAQKLTGLNIESYEDIKKAAAVFISQGVKSVFIKGGHFDSDEWSQDYWFDGSQGFWLAQERVVGKSFHGTGCTLSSAITALLAREYPLQEALILAKMYVTQGIRQPQALGRGAPAVQHISFPNNEEDLPYTLQNPIEKKSEDFPACGYDLGLYPVVDSASWIERLLPLGIKTIQLRIKDKTGEALEAEIKKAIALSEHYDARLFVNDYWELAIKHKAYGVHLGQEDLVRADIDRIRAAGLRLGLSTHSYDELATAHAHRPSYMAFGPIFATTSKEMAFGPQGIEKLTQMRGLINYPLVAIGGIGLNNIADVVATGVDSIAMISAITHAEDFEGVVAELQGQI